MSSRIIRKHLTKANVRPAAETILNAAVGGKKHFADEKSVPNRSCLVWREQPHSARLASRAGGRSFNKTRVSKVVEQLQAELERRKNDEGELQKPVQLAVPDFAPLCEICLQYIDTLANKEADADANYIYECAMECIYGKDVWKWINAQIK